MSNLLYRWLKLITVVMLATTAITFVVMAYSIDDDFAHRNNLSRTSKNDLTSGIPQILVKGANMAIVWSDGANAEVGAKDRGNIYLKTARDGNNYAIGEGYWRGKVPVFRANDNEWGQNPDFVFDTDDENIVHIIWSQSIECNRFGDTCKFEKIRYRQCDMSTDVNTCAASETIINTPGATVINPQIVQDNAGDLHAIWQRDDDVQKPVFYSRRDNATGQWSTASEVSQMLNGEDARLYHHNGRVHVVWDGGAEIRYFYDNTLNDNLLTISDFSSRLFVSDNSLYIDPGRPTITGEGDWLFVAFDAQNSTAVLSNRFRLYYNLSRNNGGSWGTQSKRITHDSLAGDAVSYDPNDESLDEEQKNLRLGPTLAISSSGTITQVYAMWHERLLSPDLVRRERILFSSTAVDMTDDGALGWSEAKKATHTNDNQLLEEETINPWLAVTELANGNQTGHLIYQEQLDETDSNPNSTIKPIEIFYEGGISGTMDPEYVIDNFIGPSGNPGSANSFKKVTPIIIETSGPIEADLSYTIAFTNAGDLDAIGIGITDTLPIHTTYNAGSLKTFINNLPAVGTDIATYNPSDNVVVWHKAVLASGESARIEFSVKTTTNLPIPSYATNVVTMWNRNLGPTQIITTTSASTNIASSILLFPYISR